MPDHHSSRPFGLNALAAAYFFFLLLTVSSYGSPFPLLGSIHTGSASHFLVFIDSMVSLYLLIGILKRQRLTVWLIIGYNLFDVVNACINILLIAPADYARLAGNPVPEQELRLQTLAAALLLIFISVYVFYRRNHFTNRSPYLFD